MPCPFSLLLFLLFLSPVVVPPDGNQDAILEDGVFLRNVGSKTSMTMQEEAFPMAAGASFMGFNNFIEISVRYSSP